MREVLSKLFTILGVICLIAGMYFVFERTNPKRLAFDNHIIDSKSYGGSEYPKKIIIKDLSIDLPIIPTTYTTNKWEATTKGVSYVRNSPTPGSRGNSILYGHNYENLLGELPKIKPGAEIEIIFSNNKKRKFIVEYTSVVSPDQTHILQKSNDKRITIYTCTGFLDMKRFVAVAIAS